MPKKFASGGQNPRFIFVPNYFFFRFHWIKHPQKPYFRPLDHFSTTRVPFLSHFAFSKISHVLRQMDSRFQPFRHPDKNVFGFFPSPGHIWDGPEWFISYQNDKMRTAACTQWPIWALNAPEAPPKRPQNPQNGPFCPILGGQKCAIFSSQFLFFRFHWIKHPQKPYFRPLDDFSTTRVPFL